LTMLFSFDPSHGVAVEPIAAVGPATQRTPIGADIPSALPELDRRHLA
jgi:hypothetical protein